MAKVMKKSALASKIGSALKRHAADETDYGRDFTNLPPGIVGGVAQLTSAAVGVYKKGDNEGEKFLRLAGTVVEPDEVNVVRKVFQDGKVVNMPMETVRVKGLQTSRMLPLCDTKNGKGEVTSSDDNVATALNELRMLGGEEFTAGLADAQDPEAELDALLASLVEAGPFFKFNTSSGTPTAQYPNERTWENWRGAIADYAPGENGEAVVDETEEKAAPKAAAGKKGSKAPKAAEPEEEATEGSEEDDLDALGEAADRNDADDEECVAAQNRLQEIAAEQDVDPDAKDKKGKPIFPTWASLVEALKPEGDEGEEEEEVKPAKEEVWNCKLPHTKKAVQVEITAVNEKKRLVNVKRCDTGNVVKDVSWDLLEQ